MKSLDIIQPNETWNIIDSSKLTTFMECPRKYFYRHILGWESSFPNNHLVFGVSWHLSMEHMMREKYTEKSLDEAKKMFMHNYRQSLPSSFDDDYAPKTPANALNSLDDYYQKYFRKDTSQYEILHTEVGGQVLIGEDMPVVFRLDAVAYDKQREIFLDIDHKTSQRKMNNFGELFSMSAQMFIYLHVMNCLYRDESNLPPEIEIRHSFFYKSKPTEFEESQIAKSVDQMESAISALATWYESIRNNLEILVHEDTDSNETMDSFQQNYTSCFNYGQPCTYLNICNAWSNPLQRCGDGPPMSMEVKHWNPADQPVREVIDLTK